MKIIRFKGGLGNQMFQYAFYLSLKQYRNDVKGYLGYYSDGGDGNPYVLDKVFPNARLELCEESEYEYLNQKYRRDCTSHIGCFLNKHVKGYRSMWMEEGSGIYDESVYRAKDCIFNGYWQTERYFKEIEDIVRKHFVFSYGEEKLQSLENELREKETVAIHVRRGDYLLDMNAKMFGGICTLDYYKKAIAIVQKQFPNIEFVVFSNDLQWVKDNLPLENAMYVSKDLFDDYQDWYDMYLMSKCKHNIIANSSFSWWGAWLNNYEKKLVIAPSKWLNDCDTRDLWPTDWQKI